MLQILPPVRQGGFQIVKPCFILIRGDEKLVPGDWYSGLCCCQIRQRQVKGVFQTVDMGALIAVAVGGAGSDGGMADIMAGEDGTVSV